MNVYWLLLYYFPFFQRYLELIAILVIFLQKIYRKLI